MIINMKVRIAAWNMAYWSHKKYHEEAWSYLLNDLDADILLFQEAIIPKVLRDDKNLIWHNAGESKGRREWGTGIYSKGYPLSEEPEESIPKWSIQRFKELCTVANVKINENNRLTLISLYGRIDRIGSIGYSIPNLHRIISDLTGILNGHINGKRKIVLGGDLNASVQCDQQWGGDAHRIFFDRINDFGLMNCFNPFHNGFVQTHRHKGSKINWQNDYLFISSSISNKLIKCEVIDNDFVRKYSDHNPIFITLEL